MGVFFDEFYTVRNMNVIQDITRSSLGSVYRKKKLNSNKSLDIKQKVKEQRMGETKCPLKTEARSSTTTILVATSQSLAL